MSSILRQDNSKNELEDKFHKYYTPLKSVEPKNGTYFVLYSPYTRKQVYLTNTSGNKIRLIPNGGSLTSPFYMNSHKSRAMFKVKELRQY